MHKNDQMVPMERLEAFMTGKPMDRILSMPLICSMSGSCAGMTHREKRSSAKNEAICQIEGYKKFGNDLLIAEYGLHTIGKALGTIMSEPENSVPAIQEHVLKDLDKIDELDFDRVRLQNSKDFQLHLDCVKILVERMGSEVPIGTLITGPFTAMASIYPVEKLLKATRKNPDKVHQLMRLCTDILKEIHVEFIKEGSMILFCDPIASGSLISAQDYEKYVLPYSTELMENIHQNNGVVCYHICGDTSRIVGKMAKAKPDMISIDNRVKMTLAKEEIGFDMPIVGNVDPVSVMIMGDRQKVDEAVLKCIQDSHDSPKGYILCTGCDLNGNVPLENLDAFMQAARKYGKWPVQESNWL